MDVTHSREIGIGYRVIAFNACRCTKRCEEYVHNYHVHVFAFVVRWQRGIRFHHLDPKSNGSTMVRRSLVASIQLTLLLLFHPLLAFSCLRLLQCCVSLFSFGEYMRTKTAFSLSIIRAPILPLFIAYDAESFFHNDYFVWHLKVLTKAL